MSARLVGVDDSDYLLPDAVLTALYAALSSEVLSTESELHAAIDTAAGALAGLSGSALRTALVAAFIPISGLDEAAASVVAESDSDLRAALSAVYQLKSGLASAVNTVVQDTGSALRATLNGLYAAKSTKVVTVTADYTAGATDDILICSAAATVTLADSTTITDHPVRVANTSSSASVTLKQDDADSTVQGAATIILTSGQSVLLVAKGIDYIKVGS